MSKNTTNTCYTPREGLVVYLKFKGAEVSACIEDKKTFSSKGGVSRKKPKMYYHCTFESKEKLKEAMQDFYDNGGKEIEDAMDSIRKMRINVWKDYKEKKNDEKQEG